MPDRIHILIVEDNANDAELLIGKLRRADFDPEWRRVVSEEDFLESLRPDLEIIICDFQLPRFDGFRALELLRKRNYDIPFIMVSGVIGEESAVKAIKLGASDYLLKDRLGRLGTAVRQAMEQTRLRKECHKYNEAQKDGEYKFRTLFDAANDSIYMIRDGVFVDCNRKGENIYGRTRDEILGHSPVEFAPPTQPDGRNSLEKAEKILAQAQAGKPLHFEWASYHRDGSLVYSDVSLSRLELGEKIHLMAVVRDSTENKRAQAQIAEQAAFLDKARDAIIVRDLAGKIILWNEGAQRMYGWTRQEVIGRNILDILHTDPDKFAEQTGQIICEGEFHGELKHLTKDRREISVEVNCTLMRDDAGHPKSVLSINTDVTEKKKMEAQFMRAQRVESIGALAGGIAHDLNNILSPILMSIDLLKTSAANPTTAKVLTSIETSAQRGAYIVRQLLSFALGLEGQRIEVNLKPVLADLEGLIRDTFPKDVQVKFFAQEDVWPILGDPTQVHQILLNLCLNARDAMPHGGSLTVAAANREFEDGDSSKPAELRNGRYVNIGVADSGEGIAPEILDRIFEPFFTTKEFNKGTGLGLSTVMAIVKSHHGFLHVESEPGQGTTFEVYLPVIDVSPEVQKEPSDVLDLPRGHGEMVLVVDDEASILAVTKHTLEAFGYRTLTASNGAEAVAIYQEVGDDISAVLTDMAMPIMDGATTIRTLKEINPEVRIIASSGLATNGNAIGSDNGPRHFLAKPYSAGTLLKTLRETLDEIDAPIPAILTQPCLAGGGD